MLVSSKSGRGPSREIARAGRIARLIAEDFFGDRLELASRDMSREDEELMRRRSPSSSD